MKLECVSYDRENYKENMYMQKVLSVPGSVLSVNGCLTVGTGVTTVKEHCIMVHVTSVVCMSFVLAINMSDGGI